MGTNDVVRISLKNADNIFSEKYWKTVFDDIITYEVENSVPDPDYMSETEVSVYDEIWQDLLSENDRTILFENNKSEYYFWIHNLTDEYFEKYLDLMESGKELTKIIQEELEETEMEQLEKLKADEMYKRHLENDGLITFVNTHKHTIISSTDLDKLNSAKNELLLSGYLIYDSRIKRIKSKTLYSYVYDISSLTQPFCPN